MSVSTRESTLGQFEQETDIAPTLEVPGCRYDPEEQSYLMQGSGEKVWFEKDGFHFLWKRLSGDFILTMQASFSKSGGHPHKKLGWMARTSLNPDSTHVCTALHGDGSIALQFRRQAGAAMQEVQTNIVNADIFRLERKGDTYRMSVAKYGDPFEDFQVSGISLGRHVYAGLFVCSHDENSLEQATFHNVRLVRPVEAGFDPAKDPLGSNLELLELPSGRRRIILRTKDVIEAPNWTRDGKALIYNKGGRLVRFDLASGATEPIDSGTVVRNNNDHVLSFDGSRLGISSHSELDGHSRIYTLPAQGGQPKCITPAGPSYLHGWSPDGKFLVYTGQRNGQFDIYRIPVEGGEEEQLTNTAGLEDGPEYSPDGRTIYFNSVRSGGMQIWRMRADGSRQEQMTDDENNNWFPHISPDGRWVVFISYLPGETDPSDHPPAKRVNLRLMPAEGGQPRVIAYLYGGQGSLNVPSWAPDGKRLAFISNTVPMP